MRALKTAFDTLTAELGRWPDGEATFWWRDDDAVSDTAELRLLLDLNQKFAFPLALAAVPAYAGPDLAAAIGDRPNIKVWQHGYAHANHAKASAKKAELGDDRPLNEIIGELESGRERMRQLFGPLFQPVLVPPWNRIGSAVRAALPAAEFERLSTVKARDLEAWPREVNVHADIIDWRGSRGFVGEEVVIGALASHLAARRRGEADRREPTGILSHHLSHDEACWSFLTQLFDRIALHPAARMLSPDDLPW